MLPNIPKQIEKLKKKSQIFYLLHWNITKMNQGEHIPKIGGGRRETERAVVLSRTSTDHKGFLDNVCMQI